jgi:hypothetical protein
VYLNLGLVGLALLGGVLWTALRNSRRRLLDAYYATGNLDDSLYQTFGIAYIFAYLFYNITEATFMGLNFLFIVFLFLAYDFQRTNFPADTSDDSGSGDDGIFSDGTVSDSSYDVAISSIRTAS